MGTNLRYHEPLSPVSLQSMTNEIGQAMAYANQTASEMMPGDAGRFWDMLFLNRAKKPLLTVFQQVWREFRLPDPVTKEAVIKLGAKHELRTTFFVALPMPGIQEKREFDCPAIQLMISLSVSPDGKSWVYKQNITKRFLVSRDLWNRFIWGNMKQERVSRITRMVAEEYLDVQIYEKD